MQRHFQPALDFLEIELIDFLRRLYVLISENKQTPSTENLTQLLCDAYEDTSPVFVDEDRNSRDDGNKLMAESNEKSTLLLFLHAEICYLDGHRPTSIGAERFLRNLTHLAREADQLNSWDALRRTLRRSLEINLLERILQSDGDIALWHLIASRDEIIEPEKIPLFAWAAAIYQEIESNRYDPDDKIFTYKQWPPNDKYYPQFAWRNVYSSRDQRLLILAEIQRIICQRFTPKECESLIAAAHFFHIAFPEAEGIGNADADVFGEDVLNLWRGFAPHRESFEKTLGLSEAFDAEWAVVAQVLWQHHRWGRDFHEEAAAYFLERALTLRLSTPVHYLRFVGVYQPSPDEKVALKHPTAINHYYWAEYLFYFKKDLTRALEHYLFFIKEEPSFLPNNIFSLDGRFHSRRLYPASTQEALTQVAKIYLQQKKLSDAGNYVEEAIALRPQNFQAPYEVLALVQELQGNYREAIALLEKKRKVMQDTKPHPGVGATKREPQPRFYLEFDPTQETIGLFYDEYSRTKLVYQRDLQQKINSLRKRSER